MSEGEFSVVQYFENEQYEYVLRFVDAETAMKRTEQLINSVGAKLGTTRKVIVTDGGDCINFEWQFGRGITFPPKEAIMGTQLQKQKEEQTNYATLAGKTRKLNDLLDDLIACSRVHEHRTKNWTEGVPESMEELLKKRKELEDFVLNQIRENERLTKECEELEDKIEILKKG